MKYQILNSFQLLRSRLGLSERELALRAGISRTCLREIFTASRTLTIKSILNLAQFFKLKVTLLVHGEEEVFSEYSTVAAAIKVERDGFDSWKIHFMDLVDEFVRTTDPRLIILSPPRKMDLRLQALLASIVRMLCEEAKMMTPHWATRKYFLASPWFVSEMENLKATAILESPLPFRQNNIFVHENFLARV